MAVIDIRIFVDFSKKKLSNGRSNCHKVGVIGTLEVNDAVHT